MPIALGEGAPVQIASSPAPCGAIASLPLNERPAALSMRNKKVRGSSSRFSTGIISLPVADQSRERLAPV